MYSLVLMMAMSHGAAAAPGWQGGEVDSRGTNFIHATAHEHYRHGCHGCWGGCYGGCHGCWGGCYGCYGGWSCCGGWYGGCYGGCYGGWGGYSGGRGYAYSSYGMPYGSYAGMPAYGGYTSGYYSPGASDAGFYGAPAGAPGAAPAGAPGAGRGVEGARPEDRGAPSDRGRDRGREKDEESRESLAPAPATLIVNLPADATLTVDGYVARSKAGTRSFVSPPLERGQDYHYTLKAELRRGDELLTVTRDVTIRAGQETRVTLDFAGASVAKK